MSPEFNSESFSSFDFRVHFSWDCLHNTILSMSKSFVLSPGGSLVALGQAHYAHPPGCLQRTLKYCHIISDFVSS